MNSHGGHLQPELIIVEFLDDDNRPVAEGEAGEVTITTLGVKGCPCYASRQATSVTTIHRPLRLADETPSD